MADRNIFVISDLHMGDGGPRDNFAVGDRNIQFRSFLDHVAEENGELIILGDLFEFWQASVGKVLTTHRDILDRLDELKATYVVGNHDADLQALIGTNLLNHPFFSRMTGPYERIIDSKRYRFMHGHEVDDFNKGDTPGWGRMMAIFAGICEDKNGAPSLGSGSVEGALTRIGEWFLWVWKWLANRSTTDKSKKTKSIKGELTPAQNPGREQEMLRLYFEDRQKEGYDVAVVGHTHQPKAVDGWYFNSGSWAGLANEFLLITPSGQIKLGKWQNGKTSFGQMSSEPS